MVQQPALLRHPHNPTLSTSIHSLTTMEQRVLKINRGNLAYHLPDPTITTMLLLSHLKDRSRDPILTTTSGHHLAWATTSPRLFIKRACSRRWSKVTRWRCAPISLPSITSSSSDYILSRSDRTLLSMGWWHRLIELYAFKRLVYRARILYSLLVW